MKTSTLLINFKYITFGLVIAGVIGLVHADFALPTAPAPGANIPAPLHTGPNQVKDGGLSVGTFLANQNAQFEQQTFLNGTVFGGVPGATTSTVSIGDGTAAANMSVHGNLSAASFIQSTSVENGNSSNLCASSNGTIIVCTGGATNTPTIIELGNATQKDAQTNQLFSIGSSVEPGNKFNISMYYHTVTVTAAAGDNAESIVQKMVAAINNTTDAQWRENPYLGTTSRPGDPNVAPPDGTPGYPPTAQSNLGNASFLQVTLDSAHQVSIYNASAQ